mmetsp:Transcript_14638/g.47667  ORF Transcript_14638/g.47667 Transcript_14638/m.47667 type:complete len:593 (-) Transcript_14638:224-2002(-)
MESSAPWRRRRKTNCGSKWRRTSSGRCSSRGRCCPSCAPSDPVPSPRSRPCAGPRATRGRAPTARRSSPSKAPRRPSRAKSSPSTSRSSSSSPGPSGRTSPDPTSSSCRRWTPTTTPSATSATTSSPSTRTSRATPRRPPRPSTTPSSPTRRPSASSSAPTPSTACAPRPSPSSRTSPTGKTSPAPPSSLLLRKKTRNDTFSLKARPHRVSCCRFLLLRRTNERTIFLASFLSKSPKYSFSYVFPPSCHFSLFSPKVVVRVISPPPSNGSWSPEDGRLALEGWNGLVSEARGEVLPSTGRAPVGGLAGLGVRRAVRRGFVRGPAGEEAAGVEASDVAVGIEAGLDEGRAEGALGDEVGLRSVAVFADDEVRAFFLSSSSFAHVVGGVVKKVIKKVVGDLEDDGGEVAVDDGEAVAGAEAGAVPDARPAPAVDVGGSVVPPLYSRRRKGPGVEFGEALRMDHIGPNSEDPLVARGVVRFGAEEAPKSRGDREEGRPRRPAVAQRGAVPRVRRSAAAGFDGPGVGGAPEVEEDVSQQRRTAPAPENRPNPRLHRLRGGLGDHPEEVRPLQGREDRLANVRLDRGEDSGTHLARD